MRDGAVAVLAKAPIAGYAKTRLIPLLGPEGAARLQGRLVDRTLATAVAAGIGPVTLWGAPDAGHPFFQEQARQRGIGLAAQPDGDLGARMLAAFRAAPLGAALVLIGTDCPVLDAADLGKAAAVLSHADVALAAAEDGGYGLIAALRPLPKLFAQMPWGSDRVAELTRERARGEGLRLAELRTIWDVDNGADLKRLRAAGLIDLADLTPAASR